MLKCYFYHAQTVRRVEADLPLGLWTVRPSLGRLRGVFQGFEILYEDESRHERFLVAAHASDPYAVREVRPNA